MKVTENYILVKGFLSNDTVILYDRVHLKILVYERNNPALDRTDICKKMYDKKQDKVGANMYADLIKSSDYVHIYDDDIICKTNEIKEIAEALKNERKKQIEGTLMLLEKHTNVISSGKEIDRLLWM